MHDALERDGPKCNMEMKKAIKSVEDIIDDPNKWEQLDGNLFQILQFIFILLSETTFLGI